MRSPFLACLLALAACRDDGTVTIGPAPPTRIEIGLEDGFHRIVYELPDESWRPEERIKDIDPRAFTYRSGERTLDVFFSQVESFDFHVEAVEKVAEAMRGAGARVGTIAVDRNRRRAGFRATGLPSPDGAPRTARVELLRTGAFPAIYATVVLRTPSDDPFDLEKFVRTIKVIRQ